MTSARIVRNAGCCGLGVTYWATVSQFALVAMCGYFGGSRQFGRDPPPKLAGFTEKGTRNIGIDYHGRRVNHDGLPRGGNEPQSDTDGDRNSDATDRSTEPEDSRDTGHDFFPVRNQYGFGAKRQQGR